MVKSPYFDPTTNVDEKLYSSKMNLVHVLRPISIFSRIFGLLPFSIILDSNGDIRRARVRFSDILWFMTSICIYLIMALHCYQNLIVPETSNESFILIVINYFRLISGLVFGAIMVTIDMFNRSKFITMFKKIIFFDKEVYFQMFII